MAASFLGHQLITGFRLTWPRHGRFGVKDAATTLVERGVVESW